MILNLYYSICGFAELRTESGVPEKFINACTKGGIFIWDVKKEGDNIRFSASAKSMDSIFEIAEKSGCGLEIISRHGLKYFMLGFKKRYALMIGFLIFSALLLFASSLVWKIEIDGCEQTKRSDIIKILNENGVKKFAFKRNIDTKSISRKIVCGIRGVSWTGTELKGGVLKIQIKERREIPYIVDDETPYDIVAAKDGVITEMRIRNGEKLKDVGSKVSAGEIIVSALVEKDGEYELPNPYTVHSFGEVIAKTWYEFDINQPLFSEKISYSGAKMTRNRIKISKFPINLYFRGSILYAEYDKIVRSRGRFLKFETETLYEKQISRTDLTVRQAVDEAVYKASKLLPKEALSAECVGSDYTVENNSLNVHIVFECTENIAIEQRYTERRENINDDDNSGNS